MCWSTGGSFDPSWAEFRIEQTLAHASYRVWLVWDGDGDGGGVSSLTPPGSLTYRPISFANRIDCVAGKAA